ncbi:MAG: uroporphyrinogen-III synthase, partial [Dechloromonas sp.]|nr:uroporphyrinogen-III synthase [Dechloromonas sp.]
MSASGPLAGRTIVVTRPQAQAAPLAEAIAAAGGSPLIFPLLEIAPASDPQPLADAVNRLADYALAVFISPNAVDHALPAILERGSWPTTLLPAAVGQGTVRALAAHGVTGCIAPTERFDSEALLELAALADERVAGRRVAIFRGDGGRELLADTLRERGATVDCVT